MVDQLSRLYDTPAARSRVSALLLTISLIMSWTADVAAQAYPARPVTLIYPYPAGSTTEVAWRVITQEAAKSLGQAFLVDNRPGAGGQIGFEMMRRAAPDGYTLSIMNNAMGVSQALLDPKFRIQPRQDYLPVSTAFETYYVLLSSPTLPFRDIKGLIAYAKSNPGKLNVGTSGNGGGSHLSMLMLNQVAGINTLNVPYKGEAQAMTDLITGQVQLFFGVGAAKPHVESGKVIALSVTGEQRWPLFPDVPTFGELGLPEIQVLVWHGLIAPVGLPGEAASRLSQVLGIALQNVEVRQKLASAGLVGRASTPDAFTAFIRTDMARWDKIIRAMNIKLD